MAGEYTLDDVAPATAAPAQSTYTVDDVAGVDEAQPANPPAQAGTAGYVAARAAGGALDPLRHFSSAQALGPAAVPTDFNDEEDLLGGKTGDQFANKAIYGTTNVPAPNVPAKFLGDLAATVASNPVGAVTAAPETALASGASTAANLAGLPPWLGVVAAPFLAMLAKSGAAGAKIALPTARDAARAVLSPGRAGIVNAGRALSSVDSTAALSQPSAANVASAADSVRAATADVAEGAAPAAQVGSKIQSDLVARQAALKAQREAETAPIAAARDASTATIDTDPVVSVIADKLKTAAGPQATAINGALNDLKMPSGAMRAQADQLAASRQAINARISAAKAAGDDATVKHLSDIRSALDAQVNAAVPEAGQFTSAYKAASAPLDVFTPGRSTVDTVPNVVARDSFGNLNGTPPSEIPDAFLRGSATKEKLDQLVQAYGGDKAAAESALGQHLAEVAGTAVNPDGTLDPFKFAKAMQPYQKVLTTPKGPSRVATLAPDTVGPDVLKLVAPTGKPGINLETIAGRTRAINGVTGTPPTPKTVVFRDANGAPQGVADFSHGAPTTYVNPALRGQGVATRLYDFANKNGINVGDLSGSGSMTPAGAALSSKWNAGNVGAWFPNLKAKFATAQAAQNTLDTISAQHGLTSGIANGELRNADGLVTAKSFGDWLKTNKTQLVKAQSPAAVSRLQQLAAAVGKAGNATTEAMMTEVVPTIAGMATGGVEGGILGGMMHKIASTAYKPFAGRYNEAFSSAIERATLDPAYAKQLVAKLPRGPYSAAAAARALASAIASVPAKSATAALTVGQSRASSRQ